MGNTYKEAMLFGFILGDGWISQRFYGPNKKYSWIMGGASGDLASLEIARQDLKDLYGDIGIATLRSEESHSPSYGIRGTSNSFAFTRETCLRFIEMGMPIGKRIDQVYLIPNWIMDGPLDIRRAFLSGFYAAEGFTPTMQSNDRTVKLMGMNFHKRYELKENAQAFADQISSILTDIGVESNTRMRTVHTNAKNVQVEMHFANSMESTINLLSALDLRYAQDKEAKRKQILSYYKEKEHKIAELASLKDYYLSTPGVTATSIQRDYGVSSSTVYNWKYYPERSIIVPRSFPTFTDFASLSLQEATPVDH